MSPENTKKLLADFPYLFRLYYKTVQESPMPCGFCCGDGWFEVIYELSHRIEACLKDEPKEIVDGFAVAQVKEKFGGLRYYVDGGTEKIDQLIREAEKKCMTTCEKCGQPGKLRSGSWLLTLCDLCDEKRRRFWAIRYGLP